MYFITKTNTFYFTVQLLNAINVQYLNIFMDNNQDYLNLLRKIKSKPQSTQRELAEDLGFSLGKLNYCLKELKYHKFYSILCIYEKNIHNHFSSLLEVLIVIISQNLRYDF